ncbi:MAG: hypothetical protein LBJ88_02600 [Campylobacteraceae bacterium]|nr:hypothetical protein [Campylobacteraceae bacterium]
MKKLLFLISLSAIFFLGCGGKSNVGANIQQEQAIVSTQKARVEAQDKSTLLVMATYLNNMQKYFDNTTDMIVLSYYYSPSSSQIKSDLGKPIVKLNRESIEIVELENDNELLKDVPINNKWSKYYLARSKQKEEDDTLNLTVEIYPFPLVSLELIKEL